MGESNPTSTGLSLPEERRESSDSLDPPGGVSTLICPTRRAPGSDKEHPRSAEDQDVPPWPDGRTADIMALRRGGKLTRPQPTHSRDAPCRGTYACYSSRQISLVSSSSETAPRRKVVEGVARHAARHGLAGRRERTSSKPPPPTVVAARRRGEGHLHHRRGNQWALPEEERRRHGSSFSRTLFLFFYRVLQVSLLKL